MVAPAIQHRAVNNLIFLSVLLSGFCFFWSKLGRLSDSIELPFRLGFPNSLCKVGSLGSSFLWLQLNFVVRVLRYSYFFITTKSFFMCCLGWKLCFLWWVVLKSCEFHVWLLLKSTHYPYDDLDQTMGIWHGRCSTVLNFKLKFIFSTFGDHTIDYLPDWYQYLLRSHFYCRFRGEVSAFFVAFSRSFSYLAEVKTTHLIISVREHNICFELF